MSFFMCLITLFSSLEVNHHVCSKKIFKSFHERKKKLQIISRIFVKKFYQQAYSWISLCQSFNKNCSIREIAKTSQKLQILKNLKNIRWHFCCRSFNFLFCLYLTIFFFPYYNHNTESNTIQGGWLPVFIPPQNRNCPTPKNVTQIVLTFFLPPVSNKILDTVLLLRHGF